MRIHHNQLSGSSRGHTIMAAAVLAVLVVFGAVAYAGTTTTTITQVNGIILPGPDSATTVGQPYTVNFTVTPTVPGPDTPTVSVTVSDGTDSCVGTVQTDDLGVTGGSCSLVSTTVGAPDKTLTATYSGDSNFTGSTSAGVLHTVNKGTPSFSSLSSYLISAGTPSLTLTGALAAGSVFPPSGETVSATISGPPQSGSIGDDGIFSITFTTSGLADGTYTVTYAYGGDANLNSKTDANTSLTVTLATTVTITTTSPLPSGTIGAPYNEALSAIGGTSPYTWALTLGSLPTGLTLNPNGTITGTPTVAGPSSFTVTATPSAGTPASKAFSLTIASADLKITSNSVLPLGIKGEAYSQTLTAIGGTPPYTWAKTAGSTPTGLTLNPDGTITGTPTAGGSFVFTVQVTDTAGTPASVTKDFNLTILDPLALTIRTNSALPQGTFSTPIGTPYSVTLIASGGTPAYTWGVTAGSLPSGSIPFLLDSLTGKITGTPNAAGSWLFNATVTDSALTTATSTFLLTITPANTFSISTASPLSAGTVGTAYSLAALARKRGRWPRGVCPPD